VRNQACCCYLLVPFLKLSIISSNEGRLVRPQASHRHHNCRITVVGDVMAFRPQSQQPAAKSTLHGCTGRQINPRRVLSPLEIVATLQSAQGPSCLRQGSKFGHHPYLAYGALDTLPTSLAVGNGSNINLRCAQGSTIDLIVPSWVAGRSSSRGGRIAFVRRGPTEKRGMLKPGLSWVLGFHSKGKEICWDLSVRDSTARCIRRLDESSIC
jgi:hypothetical protein